MEIIKMETIKFDSEELSLICSALEDAENVERRRSIEAIKKGDTMRAIYYDEKAEAVKIMSARLYAYLYHGESQEN